MSLSQMELSGIDYGTPRAFFAYPSQPYSCGEAIRGAAEQINKANLVSIKTWDQLRISGKSIIQEICNAIDDSMIFCADITGLNPNVMFELGYAIGRQKRIVIVFDTSFTEMKKQFDELQILSTTGYSPYRSSEDIVEEFYKEKPYSDLDATLYKQFIEPTLSSGDEQILLYLKAHHDTNASNRISTYLGNAKISVTVDDPKETTVQSLSWYGQKIYSSVGVIGHFQNPARENAKLLNAKYSFVCGLAAGMNRAMIMLAEPEFVSPLDYRDLLYRYKAANEAVTHLRQWLAPIEKDYLQSVVIREARAGISKNRSELRDFYVQIGEYLAENEPNTLENYYIETTAYREAIAGTRTIFVGRKGVGKTANLIALIAEISKDKDSVVVPLQPVGYEIEGLIRLFSNYKQRDTKGYVIESLWKFLLLTEIANATLTYLENQPPWIPRSDHDNALVELVEQHGGQLKGDFSIRLERAVNDLFNVQESSSVEQTRSGISEALHHGALKKLREVLGEVLCRKNRVALLIDNLDKAWLKTTDIDQMSEFLLGLFGAGNQLLMDLARKDSRRKPIKCTAAVFLRSDIFNRVIEIAREPDKLIASRLSWDDPEMLSNVIERRFLAAHPLANDGKELWTKYFPEPINGLQARDYILSRLLPRPRDIVFLVKASISNAVNRSHEFVNAKDLLDGEYLYSKYAMEYILVENSITIPELESVLYEFAGAEAVITQDFVLKILKKVGIPELKHFGVIEHLIWLNFLGLEIGVDEFVFSDDSREYKKNRVLAERLANAAGRKRYQVQPAFRAYLEIRDTSAVTRK